MPLATGDDTMSELQSLVHDVRYYASQGLPAKVSIPLILFLLVALRSFVAQADAPNQR